mmetsp:Transcript_13569/g.30905  ORF Transcript_13569/g.30905 Transcript_13569/m.30905 type:complete len:222 (+) Transcript_13569:2135-2800(+)
MPSPSAAKAGSCGTGAPYQSTAASGCSGVVLPPYQSSAGGAASAFSWETCVPRELFDPLLSFEGFLRALGLSATGGACSCPKVAAPKEGVGGTGASAGKSQVAAAGSVASKPAGNAPAPAAKGSPPAHGASPNGFPPPGALPNASPPNASPRGLPPNRSSPKPSNALLPLVEPGVFPRLLFFLDLPAADLSLLGGAPRYERSIGAASPGSSGRLDRISLAR